MAKNKTAWGSTTKNDTAWDSIFTTAILAGNLIVEANDLVVTALGYKQGTPFFENKNDTAWANI